MSWYLVDPCLLSAYDIQQIKKYMSLASQTAAQSGDDHPNHMSGVLLAKRTIKILLGTMYGTVSVESYFLKCLVSQIV